MSDKKYYEGYPANVCAVGVKSGESVNFCAVAWNSYVSHTPPLYSVFISPKRHSHDMILKEKKFSVSFLTKESSLLMQKFGKTSGSKIDKIREFKLEENLKIGKEGTPYLDLCYCVYEIAVTSITTLGDHSLFVGNIVNTITKEGSMTENQIVNLEQVKPVLYVGRNSYVTTTSDLEVHPDNFNV